MNIVDGVLVSYDSPPKDLVISGVRVIGAEALVNADITSVVISEGVVEIRNRAFMDCNALSRVKLPSTLLSIGDFAFSGTQVETIELPDNVNLGENVFFDTWLTLVVSDKPRIPMYKFPAGCKLVGYSLFKALETLGADRVNRDPSMLKIRIPRRRMEDAMPRIGKRKAMRRARQPIMKPPVVVPPEKLVRRSKHPARTKTPVVVPPKKLVRRSKRPAPTKTPPSGPRGGECTICLKPSCLHLNMSRRLGAPIMW